MEESVNDSCSSYVCVNNCLAVRNISLKYRLKHLMLDRWKVVGWNCEVKLRRTLIYFLYL